MSKWQRINLSAFIILIFVTVSLIYVLGKMNFSTAFDKPWHLLPTINEDSLSTTYKDSYQIMGKTPLRATLLDSTKTNVFILVDAWGVPIDENILADDFKAFERVPHKFALHRRLANYTKHAELAEFRNKSANSVYLFGGDSLQYNRFEYIPSLGFTKSIFCAICGNKDIILKIDSLLNEAEPSRFIAWTVLSSPIGEHSIIRLTLQQIANLARKHPETHFVIQGSHHPVLCGQEIKNLYKSHWVPVAILNK